VVADACLNDDISLLREGRGTLLGEDGINLSGGQKTRVSLGRALFSQSDTYLLDDVLSAVDVHVGEHILREAIGKSLKGKTVIMVTHTTKFAGFADRIIFMKEGRIIAEGDYKTIAKIP
jgi:ABC-type transport system involved in cytochrome bd biosynthesis fused ATPase/permease subunit